MKTSFDQCYSANRYFPEIGTTISEERHQDWQNLLEHLAFPKDQNPLEILFNRAPGIAKQFLPQEVEQRIKSVTQVGSATYCLITNLPIDCQLREVPVDGKRPAWKHTWVSEAVLVGISCALSLTPVSYFQEKEGALIHEVAPIDGQEELLSNTGRTTLGFHTDHAYLQRDYRPEFLMLLGLVNQGRTPTLIACVDDALTLLSSRYETVLREPRFRMETPDSIQVWGGKKLLSEWRPIISDGSNGKVEVAGILHSVRAQDKVAGAALNAFIQALEQVTQHLILEPGSLLILNNHRCLHGRGQVTQKRWLQRIFCRHSVTALCSSTKFNITSPHYAFDLEPLLLR